MRCRLILAFSIWSILGAFHSTVSGLRSGLHRVFHHLKWDSNPKGSNMFSLKGTVNGIGNKGTSIQHFKRSGEGISPYCHRAPRHQSKRTMEQSRERVFKRLCNKTIHVCIRLLYKLEYLWMVMVTDVTFAYCVQLIGKIRKNVNKSLSLSFYLL